MEKIIKIEYNYTSLGKMLYLNIDVQDNKLTVVKNGLDFQKIMEEHELKNIVADIIDNTMHWKEENLNNSVIDGFEFYLKIYTNQEVTTKHFKNVIPQNMSEFNKIIEEVTK